MQEIQILIKRLSAINHPLYRIEKILPNSIEHVRRLLPDEIIITQPIKYVWAPGPCPCPTPGCRATSYLFGCENGNGKCKPYRICQAGHATLVEK